MTIRPATQDDLDAIGEIQAASREASAWEPTSYLLYACHVAVVEGSVAGFLVFRELAAGEYEILNLGVNPAHRRQGVARSLLQDALSTRSGAWYLEARESNVPAIRLYENLGFRVAGRREDYYLDPREAAIVMRFFS